jgi:hypothetical protein
MLFRGCTVVFTTEPRLKMKHVRIGRASFLSYAIDQTHRLEISIVEILEPGMLLAGRYTPATGCPPLHRHYSVGGGCANRQKPMNQSHGHLRGFKTKRCVSAFRKAD